MLCAWFTRLDVLVVAVMSSSMVRATGVGGAESSKTEYGIDEEYVKLARERPTFAVYVLINNVACERCRMNASFLDKARKCLPRSVNLKTKICLREEQYLLEYGDNVMGIVRCYVKSLHMKLETLYCLLRANELAENPGLDVVPTATQPPTRVPLIRWPSRRPFRQMLAAGNVSEIGDKEAQPNRAELAAGEYELHPDGHRPYRRPDPDDESTRGDSAPPGANDYDDEIARWREDYWKKRRYVYSEDNDGDMVHSAGGEHHESDRPPRWQQHRRKSEESPDLEDSNGSSDERQKSRPNRRRGAAGNDRDNYRGRAPQGGYKTDQDDALENNHGRTAGRPQEGYDADQGGYLDNSGRKTPRGPPRDYEGDDERVPTNGRRIKTSGLHEGYEVDQDDDLDKRRGRRTGGPQGGYDADQWDVVDKSRRKKTRGPPGDYEDYREGVPANGRRIRTRGPLEDYESDRERNVDKNRDERAREVRGYDGDEKVLGGIHGKRTREPQGYYKDDQEEVPAKGRRRKARRPQEDYDAHREDTLDNNHEKRRGPQDYDADQDGVPANGRRKMTKRPRGGYGAERGGAMSTGRRSTRAPQGSYEADQDLSHDWSLGMEDDETPSYISGGGPERDSVKSYEHDIEGPFSTVDPDWWRRWKLERRRGRGTGLPTPDTEEELSHKRRGGWSRRLEENEASAKGIGDEVPPYKRTNRPRKNENEQGDAVFDTVRARDDKRAHTTSSGFEDFIRFDDDDGDEEPPEASGSGRDQRNEKGGIREHANARKKKHGDKRNSRALQSGLKIP
nr:sarcoplasmic reticulum histidine-rich calcium-binding protein-like [Dermacentor andersoni]XP_054932016.1 sarcoplasmic reticulum histidine-rich calcium-binding protein-like [Dermacentor andersoni]XP_054932017.1 sarcoplasmic reticulum histidine-rich calcium-binding protein-like [Dermacentor andersoni]